MKEGFVESDDQLGVCVCIYPWTLVQPETEPPITESSWAHKKNEEQHDKYHQYIP